MANSRVSRDIKVLPDVDQTVTHIRSRQARKDDLHIVRDRSLYERRFKRPFDLVVGSIAGIAAAPLALFIALIVRVGLGKPVLYTQQRVGEDGEVFTIYKFRTMRPDRRQQQAGVPAEVDRRSGHKSEDDPRHTGLGRRLRQLSLDELPQIINVFRGEMSLVGPRPEIPAIAAEGCLLYTSPSPRDQRGSRMPSSA